MSKVKELPTGKDLISCLISYVEYRIDRELQDKEAIEADGGVYYGILPTLKDQLQRLKDGSYWEIKDRTIVDIETKRKEIDRWNEIVIGRQSNVQSAPDVKLEKPMKTKKDKPKKIKDKVREITIKDDEVEELMIRLHEAKIRWAEGLEDVDQRQAWLNFYRVVGAQNKDTDDYWKHKRQAVRRLRVLEMNGLLPHQNGVMPPMEERRRIWNQNYGKEDNAK